MIELLFAFGSILLMIALMAVGVAFGRAPIQGSCGGISGQAECSLCGSNPAHCTADAVSESKAQ